MPAPTLLSWLTTLDDAALAECLRLRPDVLWGVPVRDLADLADRLEHPGSVTVAVVGLPSPWLEVLEVLTALGDGASVDAAAALLEPGATTDHRAEVQAVVHGLIGAALVVPGRGGALGVNAGLHEVFLAPLALAPPARTLLAETPAGELFSVARRWGLEVAKRKAELVDAVAERLADAGHVRRLVGSAPPAVARVLLDQAGRAIERARSAAGTGAAAVAEGDDADSFTEAARRDADAFYRYRVAGTWARQHGLAYGWDRSVDVVLPSEVLIALAPPGSRLPFRPDPPVIPTAPVAVPRLAAAAGGAVTEFLGTAMAVLELVARHPVAVLRSGGVGARELQRVAKSVRAPVEDVRLVLEVAEALELVTVTDRGLGAAGAFAGWRTRTPARRAHALLQAWLALPTIATLDRDVEGRARPALVPLDGLADPQALRVLMLSAVADLDDGTGVAAPDALDDHIRWRMPLAADPWSPQYVARTWAEAARLGVVADGALTEIGRAMLQAGGDGLEDVLAGVLPAVQTRVLIGSDLTVVVPGSPDPTVVDVLDAVAVRETRGAASTWRITPVSVREALDAGYTADGVLTALETIGGRVPQALDYLVRDVGRRHGHLRVRPAAAVLVSDDEALLAEVVVHRSLRRLVLQSVAPTVLVSTAGVQDVVAALRAAGYLPVEVSDDGAPVVALRRLPGIRGADAAPAAAPEGLTPVDPPVQGDRDVTEDPVAQLRRWAREQAAARRDDPPGPAPDPDTPEVAATRLLLGAEPTPSADLTGTERRLRENGLRLRPAEVSQLAHALVHGLPVNVRYRSASGAVTVRVISELELSGGSLFAWCHLREDQRFFTLSRVLAVSALPGPGGAEG